MTRYGSAVQRITVDVKAREHILLHVVVVVCRCSLHLGVWASHDGGLDQRGRVVAPVEGQSAGDCPDLAVLGLCHVGGDFIVTINCLKEVEIEHTETVVGGRYLAHDRCTGVDLSLGLGNGVMS